MRERIYTIDLNKQMYQVARYKQFDTNIPYTVQIVENGVDVDLSGATVLVFFEVGGKVIQKTGTIQGSKVKVLLTNDVLALEGIVNVEFSIYQQDIIVTTFTVKIEVEKSIDRKGAIESIPEWDIILALSQLKNETEKVKNDTLAIKSGVLEVKNATEKVKVETEKVKNDTLAIKSGVLEVKNATEKVKDDTLAAKTQLESNEAKRVASENTRQTNENTRQTQESSRQQAMKDFEVRFGELESANPVGEVVGARVALDGTLKANLQERLSYDFNEKANTQHRHSQNDIEGLTLDASGINVADKNNNFTSGNVEGALEEVVDSLGEKAGLTHKHSAEDITGFNIDAKNIPIEDAKNNFLGENVEKALEELASKMEIICPVYGFRIDITNSNPANKVSYIKSAIGVGVATSTGYGGWESKFIFDKIRPCGFKNGKRTEYINTDDYTKYTDGISVPDDVDIMIEFPKLYWKWTAHALYIDVELSEYKQDEGFECLAHTIGQGANAIEKGCIYIGAYLGYEETGKLRSKKGVIPTYGKTIGYFRTLAQANGSGYQQNFYYSLVMLQMLFTLMFKSTNSQTALGVGYSKDNSATAQTGGSYNKGMMFGEATGKQQVKFLGIEDFWGNLFQQIDGLYCDNRRNILISDNSVFNNDGSGYVNHGQGASSSLSGYISEIQGGNSRGFIIKGTNGSTTTHYSDYGRLSSDCHAIFGGGKTGDFGNGAFSLWLDSPTSNQSSSTGARLCYI